MPIYTRTGDTGQTGLFGGGRVSKAHARVAAYGAVDELMAFLGSALGSVRADPGRDRLGRVQHDLFAVGAHLATPPPAEGRRTPSVLPPLPTDRIEEMERWIDEADEELPPLEHFILPGGSAGAAALHVARTVCRRAERAVVDLADGDTVDPAIVGYLNRLSDLLFTLARLENHRAGVEDVQWRRERAAGSG